MEQQNQYLMQNEQNSRQMSPQKSPQIENKKVFLDNIVMMHSPHKLQKIEHPLR